MDIISTLVNAVIGFVSAVVNAILIVGVALIWGIIIAGVIGVIILLILKARERAKREN
jgi:predicted ABC-type sugar transport system permease subunit